jgi:hypothetical protein
MSLFKSNKPNPAPSNKPNDQPSDDDDEGSITIEDSQDKKKAS